MNKILILSAGLLLSTLTLSANSNGEVVYEANCKSCHMKKPMMDKSKMMQMSKAERMTMKEKMMKEMKAPPMSKVSAKLKHDFKTKEAFVNFVKDYIVNPSKEKSHCMPMALEKFGVMPPMGKSLDAAELDNIAKWVYDTFDEKWDANDEGMMCNMKGKGMGKGQGKGMKCAPGKCGGK